MRRLLGGRYSFIQPMHPLNNQLSSRGLGDRLGLGVEHASLSPRNMEPVEENTVEQVQSWQMAGAAMNDTRVLQ